MRTRLVITPRKAPVRTGLVLSFFLVFLLAPGLLPAQTDSTTEVAAENTEAEAPELIAPALTFTAVQKGHNSYELKVSLKAKVNGQFYNLYKMKLQFLAIAGDQETQLGTAITDGSGKAVFSFTNDTLPVDAEGKLSFKAVFAGNKSMEAAEETVSFKKASLEITPVKEDSLYSVQVRLSAMENGEAVPVKDVTVGIFVRRQFLPQKIGEGTTDENGEAVIEFPQGIPGDAKGNLTILGRVDENESYGNLETAAVQPWGVKVSDAAIEQPRALWSSHPPLWMLITFVVLMVAVWGHYLVIVYELFRLRKEEPHLPAHTTHS